MFYCANKLKKTKTKTKGKHVYMHKCTVCSIHLAIHYHRQPVQIQLKEKNAANLPDWLL